MCVLLKSHFTYFKNPNTPQTKKKCFSEVTVLGDLRIISLELLLLLLLSSFYQDLYSQFCNTHLISVVVPSLMQTKKKWKFKIDDLI